MNLRLGSASLALLLVFSIGCARTVPRATCDCVASHVAFDPPCGCTDVGGAVTFTCQ